VIVAMLNGLCLADRPASRTNICGDLEWRAIAVCGLWVHGVKKRWRRRSRQNESMMSGIYSRNDALYLSQVSSEPTDQRRATSSVFGEIILNVTPSKHIA
jgi:hypothetical protein